MNGRVIHWTLTKYPSACRTTPFVIPGSVKSETKSPGRRSIGTRSWTRAGRRGLGINGPKVAANAIEQVVQPRFIPEHTIGQCSPHDHNNALHKLHRVAVGGPGQMAECKRFSPPNERGFNRAFDVLLISE